MKRLIIPSLVAVLFLLSACGPGLILGAGGTVGVILGLDNGDDDKKDDPPPPTTNVAPAVVVTSVTREESPCNINYTIIDANTDLCTVEVEYDAGSGFSAATAGAGGDGLTGLASSAGGTAHVFSWDYLTDEGPSANANVSVRIRADDGQGFGSWFTLGSQAIGNDAPTISNIATAGSGNVVLVTFDFVDVNSDVGFVGTAYSIDQGANFIDVTSAEFVGNPPGSIASSTSGSPGQFIWNSSIVLPDYVGEVLLRLIPGDMPSGFSSETLGAPLVIGPANVDNSVNGPPEVGFVTVLDAATFTGEVEVDFNLLDEESDASLLMVEYTENGTTWLDATLGRQVSAGIVGPFLTSPSASQYSFLWDALADAGDSAAHVVKLRITGSDGQFGTAVESEWFTIVGNSAPSITEIEVFQNSGNITINFDVLDENFDPVSMALGYSLSGGNSFTAVPANDWVFGDPSAVESSPIGQSNVLIWDTLSTLGVANHVGVILRAIPSDAPQSAPSAGLTGNAFDSPPFPIVNDPAGADPVDVIIFTAGDGNGATMADAVNRLTVPLGGTIGLGVNVAPASATEQDCFWEIWSGSGYGSLSVHAGSAGSPTNATGSLTINDYTQFADGNTLTIHDGLFPAMVLEFDDNLGVGIGNIVITIPFTDNANAASAIAAAINSQSTAFEISAVATTNVVNLTNRIFCDLSNNTGSSVPEANAAPIVFSGSASAITPIVDMDGGTGDEFIRYTAPAAAPFGASTVTIRCSIDNPGFFTTVYREYVLYFGDAPTSVNLSPSSVSVLLTDTQQFTATVTPSTAPQLLNWIVVGGAINGTITQSGFYKAPSVMPASNSVTIKAISIDDIVFGEAIITLIPEPSSIIVSSATTAIAEIDVGNQTEQFSASVIPTAAPQTVDWRIFWNGNNMGAGNLNTVGTISNTGLYTSPNTQPVPDVISIQAVSTVRPAVLGGYSLIIKALTPTDFTLAPTAVTLTAGGAGQQFTVSNFLPVGANEAVTWSISPSNTGSVSASGFYAPPAIAIVTTTVTLSATSVVAALLRTAIITILPNAGGIPPTSITLDPTTALTFSAGEDVQFTHTVFPLTASQAVTWSIELGTGSIDSGGKYTPVSTSTDDSVTIRCTSNANGIFSEATVKVDGSGYGPIAKSNVGLEVTRHDSLLYYESSSGTEQIWHVGGISKFTGNEYDFTVMVHDIDADTWTEAPPVGYHTSSSTQNITQDAESLSSVISDGGVIYSVVGFTTSTEVWSYNVTQGYTGDWALESTSGIVFPGGKHHPLMIYPAAGAAGTPMTERWLMLVDGDRDVFPFAIATGNWLSRRPILNFSNAPNEPDRCGWVHAKDSSDPRFFFVGTDDDTPENGVWHIRVADQGASPPALQWRAHSSSGEPSSALRNPAVTWRKTSAASGELVVFGGEDELTGDYKQEGWEIQYNAVGASSANWILTVPSFLEPSPTGPEITYPAARRGATLTINAFDDEVYLYGGDSGIGKFGDYWGFSYPGNFTPLLLTIEGLEPAGRTYPAATIDAVGTIWVYGGITDAGVSDEFWILENYDPDTGDGDWSVVHASSPVLGDIPPALWGASLEYDATSDILYLFGGGLDLTGGSYNSDVYQFSVSVGEWTRHQLTSGPSATAGRATYLDASNDRIFSFGGSDSGGIGSSNMYNDFFVLDISAATPVWAAVTNTGTPVGREFATLGYDAVADKIYLLGGFDGTTGQTQMFVYTSATSSWQQQTVIVPVSLSPEDVHSSGGVWDSENLRFFNAPSQKSRFQSVTITTSGASWHDLIAPAKNNTTNSVGVYDSTSGYYICLFGRRVIKGLSTGTNIVKSFKVK